MKGTHNSGTGEASYKWYHKLLIPFARCQSKTIQLQLDAGCTYFDIRVYREANGIYRICHGLWRSKKDLKEILKVLNSSTSKIFMLITFENSNIKELWIAEIEKLIPEGNIYLTLINHKSSKEWIVLREYPNYVPVIQLFLPLDGTTWHTYLPIPWLWKLFYFKNPQWSKAYYSLVDFL